MNSETVKNSYKSVMDKEIWVGGVDQPNYSKNHLQLISNKKPMLFVNEIKGSEKKKCVAVQPTDMQSEHEETFQCIYTK